MSRVCRIRRRSLGHHSRTHRGRRRYVGYGTISPRKLKIVLSDYPKSGFRELRIGSQPQFSISSLYNYIKTILSKRFIALRTFDMA